MRQSKEERASVKHNWYIQNRNVCIARQLKRQQENIEDYKKYQKDYHKKYKDVSAQLRVELWKNKHPKKAKAHSCISSLRQKGVVQNEPCAICNITKTECHHFDYFLPMCVVHLCKKCHRKIHSGEISSKQIQEVFVYEI